MKRRALFVGVENYEDDGIQNLRYAIDDAQAMSAAFSRLGFETTYLRDRSQVDVLKAISNSTRDLHAGDLFLFFSRAMGFRSAARTWSFVQRTGVATFGAASARG